MPGSPQSDPHILKACRHCLQQVEHARRYAEPIDWNGQPAEFVVGIAGAGDDHLTLLSQLAGVFSDVDQVERLRAAGSVEEVLGILSDQG